MQVHNMFPMIVAADLSAAKTFYQNLGFAVVFDSPGYLHVVWPGSKHQIGFIGPNPPEEEQSPAGSFGGAGLYLAIATKGVRELRAELLTKGFKASDMREEPWGSRHFHVKDPLGVIVQFAEEIPEAPEFKPAMDTMRARMAELAPV